MLSLGYFSLHEQREVTRSCEAGAKALLSCFRFHDWPLTWPFDYRVGTGIQGKPEQGRKQGQRLSLPYGARATFLCSCKETWPKETRPCLRAQPAQRAGSTPPAGFFDETSMSRRKTTRVHARRPSGFSRRLRRCGRGYGKSKATAKAEAKAEAEAPIRGDSRAAAAGAAGSRLPRRTSRQKQKRRPRRRRPGSRERPDQNFGSNSAAWPVLTITFCSASHTFRLPATTCWVSGPLSSMRARVAPR